MILGIDPGSKGALALETGQIWDMPPDTKGVAGLIRFISENYGPLKAIIENVGGSSRQAGAHKFSFSVGVLHGVIVSNGIPLAMVQPAIWKASLGLRKLPDEKDNDYKTRSRALATQLFPHLADKFKRHMDDGRAEALLMTVYYKQRLGEK